jgi:hypothetical protein
METKEFKIEKLEEYLRNFNHKGLKDRDISWLIESPSFFKSANIMWLCHCKEEDFYYAVGEFIYHIFTNTKQNPITKEWESEGWNNFVLGFVLYW